MFFFVPSHQTSSYLAHLVIQHYPKPANSQKKHQQTNQHYQTKNESIYPKPALPKQIRISFTGISRGLFPMQVFPSSPKPPGPRLRRSHRSNSATASKAEAEVENGPFEDVFPIEHGDIPASYVSLPNIKALLRETGKPMVNSPGS